MGGTGEKFRRGFRHDATGRSTTKRRGWGRPTGPFIWQLVEMKRSPAWRVLSLSARRLLERLEIELAMHLGKDNGRLHCTYEQLIEYGIGDRTSVAAAIRECEALGFLRVIHGRGGNAEHRRPSLYRLTYQWTEDASPSNEWRHIHTIEEAKAAAKTARKGPPKPKRKAAKKQIPSTENHTGASTENQTTEEAKNAVAPVRKNPITNIYPPSGSTAARCRLPLAAGVVDTDDPAETAVTRSAARN